MFCLVTYYGDGVTSIRENEFGFTYAELGDIKLCTGRGMNYDYGKLVPRCDGWDCALEGEVCLKGSKGASSSSYRCNSDLKWAEIDVYVPVCHDWCSTVCYQYQKQNEQDNYGGF